MGLVYELCKWNKPKSSVKGTIQCALGMGLANVPWESDNPMCHGNKTIQCTLGMRLANVTGNGTSQCALGMGLANLPWEWN